MSKKNQTVIACDRCGHSETEDGIIEGPPAGWSKVVFVEQMMNLSAEEYYGFKNGRSRSILLCQDCTDKERFFLARVDADVVVKEKVNDGINGQ